MMESYYRVTVSAAHARTDATPAVAMFTTEWLLPFIPVPGDTITLPDGEDGEQVDVCNRVVALNGGVEVWLDCSGWDRQHVADVFAATEREVAHRIEAAEKAARGPMTVEVATPLNLFRRTREAVSEVRVTTNVDPGVEVGEQVIVAGPRDDTVQATVRSIEARERPRRHWSVVVDADWSTLRY